MTPGAAAAPGVEVYLLPAVVGGGLGDLEEVLLAGRRLARAGFPPILYRGPDRPEVRSLAGPWGWPAHARVGALRPAAPRAVTISAWWGVSAGPGHEGPFGRPGSWSVEASAIERAYGRENVLHVSFEEFARTLTSRAQTAERWREGGRPVREIRRRAHRAATRSEVEEFRVAYERYRAFDRAEVLHLYPTFVRSRAFAREFPNAVQTGPFWPEPLEPGPVRCRGRWIWYASPSSSGRLAERIASEWAPRGRPITIAVRSPVPIRLPPAPGLTWEELPALEPSAWARAWASAELRIATGSRTLLESLRWGGPFLYFNGVTGRGGATRRHRPEKIDALLRLWRRAGVAPPLRRALGEFSRLRSVGGAIRRARSDPGFFGRYPRPTRPRGFPAPYDDGGSLLEGIVREFDRGGLAAGELVERVRRGDAPAAPAGPSRT